MAGLVDESSDAELSDSDDLDDWDDSDDSDFDGCALEVMALREEQRTCYNDQPKSFVAYLCLCMLHQEYKNK